MKSERTLYAQGDILLERIPHKRVETWSVVPADPDGAVVLGRGEKSGHRHAIHSGGAMLVREPRGAGPAVPADLYVGHLVVAEDAVRLTHEEHAPIELEKGMYRVRRQRQYSAEADMRQRLVED